MFKELAALIPGKSDTLTVTLAHADNNGPGGAPRLRVGLIPKFGTLDKDARQVLDQPLCITGTFEELDGPDFIAGISRVNLANEGVKAAFEAAEAERKQAAATHRATAARPVKSTTTY